MDDCWSQVRMLVGETLTTVRGHAFGIDEVGSDFVRLTPVRTGKSRPVRRAEVEARYALAHNTAEVIPSRLREAGASEYNPAYVAAIVKPLHRLV